MAPPQDTYATRLAALRKEVNDSPMYYRTMGGVTDQALQGAAKMGFRTMDQAQAFKTSLDAQPPAIRNLFTEIGNRSLRSGDYDGLMRSVGGRYNNLFPKLRDDLNRNPGVAGDLREAATKFPNRLASALSRYTGQDEKGPGQLETILNQVNHPPRVQQTQTAQRTPPAPPAPKPQPQREPAARRETPPAEAPRRRTVAAADKPEPIAAAAGAGTRAPTTADAAAATAPAAGAPAADPNAPVNVTAGDVKLMAGQLSTKLLEIFPDMANDIDGFKKTIQADESQGLRERIARNLTNNPDFLKRMQEMANSKDEGTGNALRQYGRKTVQNLLSNPEQLADDKYVKELSGKLGMASGGGGFLDGIKNLFGGLDLGGIGDKIMEFLQPLIDMFKNLFAGFNANGGVSNVLSMGNGNGDMLGNALGNMQNAIDTGARVRAQQGLIERDPSVRAVDQNRDGKFDDADKIDVDGKGRKGFALEGISDQPGELKVYAQRVDPKTGQISEGSTFVVRNGQATRTNENDNEPIKPDQNRTLGQSLGAGTTGPAALNVPSPASGPPAPPAGAI